MFVGYGKSKITTLDPRMYDSTITKSFVVLFCFSDGLLSAGFSGVHNIEYVHSSFYVLSK